MYEDHYGFTGRPFQLTPDPRFWYDTTTHKKAMAYLGYGLSQGEGFIVITGDIGAGKTTLVGHLLARLDRQQLHAISIASAQIEPDDLLRIVAAGLDVSEPGATKADLLAAIERGLLAVARSGRRTLLIVDEAQALPPTALEELRMLSNLAAGGHALLQIFLLGQPEFRDRLEGSGRLEQLRQRVIALHHLGPMEADEVEPYMAHRLALVGWNGRPRFTGDAFEALHRASGGLPRQLNQLAGRVLLHGAVEQLDTIDAATVNAVAVDLASDLSTARRVPADVGPAETTPAESVSGVTPVDPDLLLRIARLEARAHDAELIGRLDVLEVEAADSSRHAELAARIDALEAQTAEPLRDLDLLTRVAALETGTVQPARDPEFAARLDAVEVQAARPARDEDLAARVVALETSGVATDLAARLVAAETRLAELTSAPDPDPELPNRVAAIEARLEEQDATLRRILTLLVDWVETSERGPTSPPPISLRA